MRLIDADALHDITKLYCENCEKRKGIKNGKLKFVYKIGDAPCKACQLYDMKDAIENAPTVDAEPIRHGHWKDIQNYYDDVYYECSACGEPWTLLDGSPSDNNMNYCPTCGAKMDEVRGEEDERNM